MTEPMRVHAAGGRIATAAHAPTPHSMGKGAGRDATGKVVAARLIIQGAAMHAGDVARPSPPGTAASNDPAVPSGLALGAKGHQRTIAWTDRRGEKRSDGAVIHWAPPK